MPTVLEQAEELRRKLKQRDNETIKKLTAAYAGTLRRLEGDIEALTAKIGEDGPTKGQLTRLAQYRRLMEDIQIEVGQYGGYLSTQISTDARVALTQGQAAAKLLVQANISERQLEIMRTYRTLNPSVIEKLLGFLQPNGALFDRIKLLPGYTADLVSQKILSGVAMGRNPRVIARDIKNAMGGGLTQALRTSITVQNYAYREANRASYLANPQIVRGWYWMADLSGNPCASCVAMHGTFHESSEVLNDHYNGHCAELPATITNPDNPLEDGQSWFDKQSEARQLEIMGASKLAAYKDGKFEFSALTRDQEDTVYGIMRTETPLKDLVNEQ